MSKWVMPVLMAWLAWAAPSPAQSVAGGAEAEVLAVVNGLFEGMRRVGVDHFLQVKEGMWKIIELADTRRRDC